jgi:hypothetical protein
MLDGNWTMEVSIVANVILHGDIIYEANRAVRLADFIVILKDVKE